MTDPGSLVAFKRRLDAFLATVVPDRPMLPQHHQCSAGNDLISQLNQKRIDSSCVDYSVLNIM